MSLVERKPGRPDGRRMLDDTREEIIRATINRYYLTKNRPGISQLVRDIETNCVSAGLSRHIAGRSKLVSKTSTSTKAPNSEANPKS